MQKNRNCQLDIFGNWKPLDKVCSEIKKDKRYKNKEFTSNKNYVKNGGVFYVNKAFIKTN